MTDVTAPSGWYPDLHVPSVLRWWDGHTWTGHMAPAEARAASTATSRAMPIRVRPTPARVPELVPLSGPEHQVSGPEPQGNRGKGGKGQDFDAEAAALFEAMADSAVKERDDLRAELRDLSAQIPTMRHQRDEIRAEVRDLARQVPTMRQERDVLQTELRDLTGQLAALRRERDDLRTAVRDLAGEVPTLQRERDDLRNEVRGLAREVPTMRQERDVLRTELQDLTGKVPTLRQERDDLLAAAAPLRAEVADLRGSQEELLALRSEIQALRQRKAALDKSLAGPPKTAQKFGTGRAKGQRFHDS
jgi:uncharacterized coiled-coil DUF342 family protein